MARDVVDFSNLALKLDEKKDAEEIIRALREKPEATCFNLSGNTLGITAAEPIGIALEQNAKLQRCLWSDLFTGRLKSEIAPALRHLSSGLMASGARLFELDLSDNAFGPNGVVGVVDLIASPVCSTLQILRMNNQGLGHEGCRHLVEALKNGRKASGGRGLQLKVFSAGRNRLENYGAQLLSEVLSDMGSLEEVSLYQNGIGIHGIEGVRALVQMMKNNSKLRILNLSDNSLTPKGGKAIAKALRSLENLEELHLSDCILRSSGVAALARALEDPEVLPNIRILTVPGNEITRNSGISLVLSLGTKPKLEILDLNANEFGKSGIRAIIKTLESVGLSHVLPIDRSVADAVNEPVGDEVENHPLYSAFNEDQGSADEEDSDAEVCGEQDHSASEYDDDNVEEEEEEEGEDEEEVDDEDENTDDKESSFNTVEERPITKPATGFSFRAMEAAMGDVCPPISKNEPVPVAKPGPFGGGLFSSLGPLPPNTADGASMRFKLWPTNTTGLFTPSPNNGFIFGKGQHLFSPPTLCSPQNSFSNQRSTPARGGENGSNQEFLVLVQLNRCLTDRKQTEHVDNLIKILDSSASNPLPVDRIQSVTLESEPEAVVRLGLQLCRHAGNTDSSQCNTVQRFAVDVLASVLMPKTSPSNLFKHASVKEGTENYASRAANCLLVHLGSIKAEKNSEDYEEVNRLDENAWEQRRVVYLSALRHLFNYHGNQLSTGSACNSIRFLLTEEGERRKARGETVASPSQSDLLRDDVLSLLGSQMSQLHIA